MPAAAREWECGACQKRSVRATTSAAHPLIDEALRIMDAEVGRIFDPELFPLFRSLILAATPLGDRRFPAFGMGAQAA